MSSSRKTSKQQAASSKQPSRGHLRSGSARGDHSSEVKEAGQITTRPLSVIVPVHNEARWIKKLIERVLAQPDVGQLIVVDDASTDNSLAMIHATVNRARVGVAVTVIPLTSNQGKGAAMNRGLTEVRLPFVIIQDADLEYDPADYRALLEPLRTGESRVVFGSRFLSGQVPVTSSQRNPSEKVASEIKSNPKPSVETGNWKLETRRGVTLHDAGNRFLSWFTSWLFGVHLTDMNTCYKCFDSSLIRHLNCTERRFAWDPQLTAQLIRLGQGIVERPISYHPRTIEEGKQLRWQDGFAQIRVLTKEWLRYPRGVGRLVISLIAIGSLITGLLANQLATIQRMKEKPFELTEPLQLAATIPLDQEPHCRTGVGFVVAGPYITLPPGRYRYQATVTSDGPIQAFADAGSPTLKRIAGQTSITGTTAVPLSLDVTFTRWSYDTEFRISSTQNAPICARHQSLERIQLFPWRAVTDVFSPIRRSQLGLPPRDE